MTAKDIAAIADAVVARLARTGAIGPGSALEGSAQIGDLCGNERNESMDPTNTTAGGASSSFTHCATR